MGRFWIVLSQNFIGSQLLRKQCFTIHEDTKKIFKYMRKRAETKNKKKTENDKKEKVFKRNWALFCIIYITFKEFNASANNIFSYIFLFLAFIFLFLWVFRVACFKHACPNAIQAVCFLFDYLKEKYSEKTKSRSFIWDFKLSSS